MMEHYVASPCCSPNMELNEFLTEYAALGFRKMEVFTGSMKSSFDIGQSADYYLNKLVPFGMKVLSYHLPHVTDDLQTSLATALQAAKQASELGAKIVLYKATTRPNYIAAAKPFLDGIEGLSLTPVLQNHAGTALSTLEDFREVLSGIADERMKTLLEVGMFHTVGVSWQEGYELLGDSIALVHIKDQIGAQSVPFGTGEIDLPGLFQYMKSVGYDGDYVIEMEVKDRENTLKYIADALHYLGRFSA